MATTYKLPWYACRLAWVTGLILLIMLTLSIAWMAKVSPHFAKTNVAKNTIDLSRLLAMQQRRTQGLEEAAAKMREALERERCDALEDAPRIEEETGAAASGGILTNSALISLLNQGVVFVLTEQGTGSGFFISPHHIVTNAHVVEHVGSGGIEVTNASLGRLVEARVVALQHSATLGGRDYALLEVSAIEASAVLSFSTRVTVLDEVVAAGYPGDYLKLWKSGTQSRGVPNLILRKGEVVYIDSFERGIPMVNHTAAIFKGNSGGPLVDRCGRVVGINSLYLAMPTTNSSGEIEGVPNKIDFAIGAMDLVRFLTEQSASSTVLDTQCGVAAEEAVEE